MGGDIETNSTQLEIHWLAQVLEEQHSKIQRDNGDEPQLMACFKEQENVKISSKATCASWLSLTCSSIAISLTQNFIGKEIQLDSKHVFIHVCV